MKEYTEDISKFPISSKLQEITDTLKNSPTRFLILTAETAAGKSTILPLKMLEEFAYDKALDSHGNKKIIMTEPRRLATLGVSSRLSELLGEKQGETVGYKIHLDKKISAGTKLEIVTEAILVRQLQNDPVLEDYNLVILDEFHERSINTDLALAFLKEAMILRDDLFVIIMSATIDTDKIQHYLGDETPVFSVSGRQFPVEVIYNHKDSIETVIEKELLYTAPQTKSIKNKANISNNGNILVFLPGIHEIRKVQENLEALFYAYNSKFKDIEICVLHSSISVQQQKNILHESPRRRVILSSSIAETSLTVPGVTCVIDSGLARINRMDINAGMERLSTETESQFSAEQRKGRGGRLMEGRCIRLWSAANPRIKDMPCEILRGDLTTLVLECAERGIYSADKIDWLEKPSDSSWNSSVFLLKQLKMLKPDGRINEKGKDCLKLGIHPRIAAIALYVFSEILEQGKSMLIKYGGYSRAAPDIQQQFLNDLERRISAIGKDKYRTKNKLHASKENIGIIALEGYPDRLCKRISPVGAKPEIYKLPSGRNIILGNDKHGTDWIAAIDIIAGEVETVAFEFEDISSDDVANWLEGRTELKKNCIFEQGKIKKSEDLCYGKIVISSKKGTPDPDDLVNAWINEINNKGLTSLPLNEKINSLLVRSEFLWSNSKEGLIFANGKCCNFVDNNANSNYFTDIIIENAGQWLPAFLGSSKTLTKNIVYDSLYWFLKGDEINKNVPEMIILPNGNKAKVKYEKLASPNNKNKLIIRPVIEIIIQRIFGCNKTPEICGIKVLLRLLSPASRPLQITDDLEGFWTCAWPDICKEMKGRYPKHNWEPF